MLARNRSRFQSRRKALGDDLALLLRRPCTPSLTARDDHHALDPRALTTCRTRTLIERAPVRRLSHAPLASPWRSTASGWIRHIAYADTRGGLRHQSAPGLCARRSAVLPEPKEAWG